MRFSFYLDPKRNTVIINPMVYIKNVFSFSSLKFYFKWCLLRLFTSFGCLNLRFALMQKKQKLFTGVYCFFCIHESSISSLKIKSLKTTLNCRSVPRAVRPMDSTCGALPLQFFVVFLCFFFKGGGEE
jgi:hypothetical protein